MKQVKTKLTIAFLSTLIIYISLNSLLKSTHPELFIWCDEDREDTEWVATSHSWLDRKVCRWLGVCGASHMHWATHPFGKHIHHKDDPDLSNGSYRQYLSELGSDAKEREIPNYVLEYAPLVHLYSEEQFWPCDPTEHLFHTTPSLNYTPIQSKDQHASLTDLDELNKWQNGQFVFLTSNDDVEERPEWLEGVKNIPKSKRAKHEQLDDHDEWVYQPPRTYVQGIKDAATNLGEYPDQDIDLDSRDSGVLQNSGETASVLRQEVEAFLKEQEQDPIKSPPDPYRNKTKGGRSAAPVILITVRKPGGILDAFWFFFYSFNLGNSVFNIRFGNHVGDWEHSAVRFKDGMPQAVYFSEHSFGSSYSYEAVEKLGKRPVIYSATGTHAMYATPGSHPYILPLGILHDQTDRGPLWDPLLNYHSYTHNPQSETFLAANLTPASPTGWLSFAGHWGDKFYQLGDKRQYRLAGQYHYVNGPLGPKFKNLGREEICDAPKGTPCVIKQWLENGERIPRGTSHGEEADRWSANHKASTNFDL